MSSISTRVNKPENTIPRRSKFRDGTRPPILGNKFGVHFVELLPWLRSRRRPVWQPSW
jgi:hypothetical protein